MADLRELMFLALYDHQQIATIKPACSCGAGDMDQIYESGAAIQGHRRHLALVLARIAEAQADDSRSRCPDCTGVFQVRTDGRLRLHRVSGVRCPGSEAFVHFVCHRTGDHCAWSGCPNQQDSKAADACFLIQPRTAAEVTR